MNNDLMLKLCEVMETVVLEKISRNAFILITGPVEWLNRICEPIETADDMLYPINGFTFIHNFIEEANLFWKKEKSGSIKSGLWIETDTSGKECFFEAAAINLISRNFLVIQKDSDSFSEKQRLIQQGRNLALNYHALEKMEKQIHADKDALEIRVKERTAELKKANEKLTNELLERKRFEKERAEMIMQIQKSQKMEAIGTLAGGIAHDFNNILSAVIGFTQMSIAKTPGGSSIENHLNQVLQAAHRAKDLVRQILTFSHQTKEEGQPTRIKTIAKEVIKLLRASLPSTIEIMSELNSDAYVMADPTRIHQVIMNLCTNASHAMEEKGGIIRIRLENILVTSNDNPFSPDLCAGQYVGLHVLDSGHGMTQEVKDRIFDPFYTTKKEGKGTGMGLSVVHGIVKRCKGTIQVESSPGSGSTFRVFWPVIEMHAPSEKQLKEKIVGGTERLLIVDDETFQTDMAAEMLESLGYSVVTQNDSTKALDLFLNDINSFNLVITDMTMPKMTGKVLANEILKKRPDMPIILCSGYSEEMTVEKARDLGIREYLMKPIGLKDMAKTVRNVLDE